MDKTSRILIVGHSGIMEESLYTYFQEEGFSHIFSSPRVGLDTLDQKAVRKFFEDEKPEYVFLGSVRSGGIGANQEFPGEFIYENLESQNNIIYASLKSGIRKLIYFSGSCAYPREAPQPIKEESLLTGPLEKTSEFYSVAKIAGIKLCQAFRKQFHFPAIIAVPATVFGPGGEEDVRSTHVITALIIKFHDAVKHQLNTVTVWGTGQPKREFLYKDDFVSACLFLVEHYDDSLPINVGTGEEISIKDLAQIIKEVSGFKGDIIFDTTKPDGTMRKVMDNSRLLALGWKPTVTLKEGIAQTYSWYAKTHS